MTYFSAKTEQIESIPTTKLVHSQAGWTGDVEYGVCYMLPDGRYLTCVRHKDCGDLATDLRAHTRRPQMKQNVYVGGKPYGASE